MMQKINMDLVMRPNIFPNQLSCIFGPLTIALVLLVSNSAQSADRFCVETGNAFIVNPGKCPSITRRWAKISTFGKHKRHCKLPRGTVFHKLKVSLKLLSHEIVVHKGKKVGCAAKWLVCTRCKLSK